eukprot:CAMPEP_0177587156 /NCGR_PEP_ID=MMETSP0419_2-20121207/5478_1 /TAXON_ID=582737 /ORGANISM="Tetraselmis sp., Strain GSL018" /LENGTH=313 /DNA_ID=CAMNT_0019077141 /DNA_START=201 /DNA_END=1143 /DNA_ORIENTATION=+
MRADSTPLASIVSIKHDCYGEPRVPGEVRVGHTSQTNMQISSLEGKKEYNTNRDRSHHPIFTNETQMALSLSNSDEDFYDKMARKPTEKPYECMDYLQLLKQQREYKEKQSGCVKSLLDEKPSQNNEIMGRPGRTVSRDDHVLHCKKVDKAGLRINEERLKTVNFKARCIFPPRPMKCWIPFRAVENSVPDSFTRGKPDSQLEQEINVSVLESRASNPLIRKMLDKKKELAPKESVAGLQSRQEGCPDEWRRIRNLLARDAIDFHKPGSEAEHSSSCIMSAHHSQQSGGSLASPPPLLTLFALILWPHLRNET